MVSHEKAVRNTGLDDAEQLARWRNTEEVRLGFENPDWYIQKRSFNIRIRAETVKYFLRDAECECILDIGCGDGSISVPLLTAHNHLTLLDMSAAMLNIARSRVPVALSPRVTVINSQLTYAAQKPGSYDTIICLGVLAYITDISGTLEKISSLLKPGGNIILECSDSGHPVSILGRGLGTVASMTSRPKVPLTLHSSSEVLSIARQFRLHLRAAFRYSLPLPGIRKVISQGFQYKSVRALFGSPAHNRNPWLGSECIFHFTRED
jgi:ubiquinone/menaquinone biosynthesis C-methylase UbiE